MDLILRKAFFDICRGYSKGLFNKRPFFIKHITPEDQMIIDEYKEKVYNEQKADGLPTEEEEEERLKKEGLWTAKNEREIVQLEKYIANLIKTKEALAQISERQKINKTIEKEQYKLKRLLALKNEQMSITCENIATKRANEFYLFKSSFADSSCTIPFFSELEFENFDDLELSKFIEAFQLGLSATSDSNMKKIVIQDLFMTMFILAEKDFGKLINKTVTNFTYYQIRLGSYAKFFSNLMEKHDISKIPQKFREDPDKLVEYINASEIGKKKLDKIKDNDIMFVNAPTKDDMNVLGIEAIPDKTFKEGLTLRDMITKYDK